MGAPVVVIGAGAAGLSAARDLHDAGIEVQVWEARARTGGRIRTHRGADGAVTEMGAQVVHGDDNAVWGVLDGAAAGVARYGAASARAVVGGRSVPLGALARGGHPPWCAEPALAAHPSDGAVSAWPGWADWPAPECALAWEWLRQRWAADPDELRTDAVAACHAAQAGERQYVLTGGFDAVPDRLAAGLDVRVERPAARVAPGDGGADVETGDGQRVRARAVVVTVPPATVGPVLRIEGLAEDRRAAARALRGGDGCVAVVTLSQPAPEDAVVFDGDAQGGFVRTAAGRPEVALVAKGRTAAALRDALAGDPGRLLARVLPWTDGAVVRAVATADWGADPFSGGAFTVPRGGAGDAPTTWARPLCGSVFFAGESTCGPTGLGSVPGAIHSGRRAAAEVLEVLE